MLNFDRGNRGPASKEPPKPGLKPALYEPPAPSAMPPAAQTPRPGAPLASQGANAPVARELASAPAATAAPTTAPSAMPAFTNDGVESRLSIGPKIKLKGVEISDCDELLIEGHVEATVFSKTMEIAEPGTLQGTALIDVAEIHGVFTGELTARTRLVIHGTGRVSGTIRYGKLVVEEGGELSGDVQRTSERESPARAAVAPAPDMKLGLAPQPATASF